MQVKKGKNISLKVEFQYHLFLKLFETREVKQCWQSDSVLKVTTWKLRIKQSAKEDWVEAAAGPKGRFNGTFCYVALV